MNSSWRVARRARPRARAPPAAGSRSWFSASLQLGGDLRRVRACAARSFSSAARQLRVDAAASSPSSALLAHVPSAAAGAGARCAATASRRARPRARARPCAARARARAPGARPCAAIHATSSSRSASFLALSRVGGFSAHARYSVHSRPQQHVVLAHLGVGGRARCASRSAASNSRIASGSAAPAALGEHVLAHLRVQLGDALGERLQAHRRHPARPPPARHAAATAAHASARITRGPRDSTAAEARPRARARASAAAKSSPARSSAAHASSSVRAARERLAGTSTSRRRRGTGHGERRRGGAPRRARRPRRARACRRGPAGSLPRSRGSGAPRRPAAPPDAARSRSAPCALGRHARERREVERRAVGRMLALVHAPTRGARRRRGRQAACAGG